MKSASLQFWKQEKEGEKVIQISNALQPFRKLNHAQKNGSLHFFSFSQIEVEKGFAALYFFIHKWNLKSHSYLRHAHPNKDLETCPHD